MQKLGIDFYRRDDVARIAQELLGKYIVTKFEQQYTVGRIVETEAYAGIIDKASHAYNNRRTARTEIMFGDAGHAYVYLCYGIHHLFNVVCNVPGKPDAVLIRGIEPVEGLPIMQQRFHQNKFNSSIGRGPGNVSKALGISVSHTGFPLQQQQLFLAEEKQEQFTTMASPRIGVDYAAEHAKWLYRFFIADHPQVTKHAVNKTAVALR
ncbi:DNA-3-methyladenine glycosylase [Lacibacter cauensis]|uniref:Putative 3-methyladenine DNA glycosylase n=1 Tax=Lacibacter cauensis TaxID=510947 RepID=A0A562SIY1_9BACT|nr:DNA-3-methyladenine glycosylase [Lacibacter cauensis]TWI81237.1 DNA-3-methyladenine glycosylase [Lacibacter cauensis]